MHDFDFNKTNMPNIFLKTQREIIDNVDNFIINVFEEIKDTQINNTSKENELRKKFKTISNCKSVSDITQFLSDNFPDASLNKLYEFRDGNATCTICKTEDNIRISYNSDSEFISYEFILNN